MCSNICDDSQQFGESFPSVPVYCMFVFICKSWVTCYYNIMCLRAVLYRLRIQSKSTQLHKSKKKLGIHCVVLLNYQTWWWSTTSLSIQGSDIYQWIKDQGVKFKRDCNIRENTTKCFIIIYLEIGRYIPYSYMRSKYNSISLYVHCIYYNETNSNLYWFAPWGGLWVSVNSGSY